MFQTEVEGAEICGIAAIGLGIAINLVISTEEAETVQLRAKGVIRSANVLHGDIGIDSLIETLGNVTNDFLEDSFDLLDFGGVVHREDTLNYVF